jgi:hypothetical protein
MFLITVTDWKRKAGVCLRLLIFLVLIGLVVPQLLNFITGELAGSKSRPEGNQAPAIRVDNRSGSSPTLIDKLQQYYRGESGAGQQ